jgi:hypothetical protein
VADVEFPRRRHHTTRAGTVCWHGVRVPGTNLSLEMRWVQKTSAATVARMSLTANEVAVLMIDAHTTSMSFSACATFRNSTTARNTKDVIPGEF